VEAERKDSRSLDQMPGISDCLPKDVEEVCAIERASFEHPYDPAAFHTYLLRARSHRSVGFLTAKVEGRVVGYVIFESGREALIVSMAVAPSYTRRGIGNALLREALKRLSGACKSVSLQVETNNRAAQMLYSRNGFRVIGTLRGYYPDGGDAYLMSRAL